MSSNKNVLIVGPGFIGWNVLENLVKESYNVTGLVRRYEHADGIEASGAIPVMGDLNDKVLIAELTVKHDIILHTATADHLPSVEAILEGIKQRATKGLMTTFIHTSGTSVLDDGCEGSHKSNKVYHDDMKEEVDSVPDSAPHRKIDLAILRARKELGDKAKIAIMIPPLIYGFNPSHARTTIQIPTLTRFALKHGFSGYIGGGKSVESNIHVLDLARAYVVLLHHMEKTDAGAADFENSYYFCETTGDNEPSWSEVASAVGKALHAAGKLKDPAPKQVPKDLWDDLFGPSTAAVIGLNSRSRANRLRALGWKPTEKDWKTSYVEDELPHMLKEELDEFKGYTGTAVS